MVLHAGQPELIESKQAGVRSPVFLMSRPTNLDNLDSFRQEAVDSAELIRKGSAICEVLDLGMTDALLEIKQKIQTGLNRGIGGLAIIMSPEIVAYSRAKDLIKDYSIQPDDEIPMVIIPTARITAINTLPFRRTPMDPEPIMDLQVQTSAAAPLTSFSYANGKRELLENPNPGSWYRFPLASIGIELVY